MYYRYYSGEVFKNTSGRKFKNVSEYTNNYGNLMLMLLDLTNNKIFSDSEIIEQIEWLKLLIKYEANQDLLIGEM
jgi:hypothetical protein